MKLVEALTTDFRPVKALVVYEHHSPDHGSGDHYYIELHEIDEKGRIAGGMPLQQSMMIDIIDTFKIKQQNLVPYHKGLIPGHVLVFDWKHNHIVWYRRPESRYAYFTEDLNIPNGELNVPGLIYSMRGNELSVYAYKDKLGGDTKLFRAPFHNISGSGVCLGSSSLKPPRDPSLENLITYWEARFWKSEFSHLSDDSPTVTNLNALLTRLIKSGEEFPQDELKPSNTKLTTLLK